MIASSARAGIAAFGAPVALRDTVLDCNSIAINGEQRDGLPFSFDIQGEVVCGCGDELRDCQVLSAALAPPEEIGERPNQP